MGQECLNNSTPCHHILKFPKFTNACREICHLRQSSDSCSSPRVCYNQLKCFPNHTFLVVMQDAILFKRLVR